MEYFEGTDSTCAQNDHHDPLSRYIARVGRGQRRATEMVEIVNDWHTEERGWSRDWVRWHH